MNRFKIVEEINDDRLCKLKLFIIKFDRLSHSCQLVYLKNIKSDEIDLISEIIFNFLINNIKTDIKSYSFLKRLRKTLYVLARKSKLCIFKR